jgi:alkaline phosphatase D
MLALDTRMQDRDITTLPGNEPYIASLAKDLKSNRSIMGGKQEKWFEDGLRASKERGPVWRLIWNQVVIGR